MQDVTSFSIPYYQYLNPQAELLEHVDDSDLIQLVSAYKTMQLVRSFDAKAIRLQRTGQLGTYPSCLGQEAIGVAIGSELKKGDVFCPYYRDQAAQISRGVSLTNILQIWGGSEQGYQFSGDSVQDLPGAIPIATQVTHAAGIASAIKIRKQPRAVLTSCGDGATSRGDFYESLNLAGVWQLPLVFVVNNNQWAISVALSSQTHCQTLAQKAIAAGIAGEQVDGNDFIALQQRIRLALKRARENKGPTLIEAISYRLSDHTTADDASRYRQQEQVDKAWQQEPIARLKKFLHQQGAWHEEQQQELEQRQQQQIKQAVDKYLQHNADNALDMFDYLYHELPKALLNQRQKMKNKVRLAGSKMNAEGK